LRKWFWSCFSPKFYNREED